MNLNIVNLGRMDYEKALMIQEGLHSMRRSNKVEDTLLLVEHPPVLTVGRRGAEANILISKEKLESMGVKIYEVSRGGDVTYHGPGQVVGYPIMDLHNHGRDIKDFVRRIEEVFIILLGREYSLKAYRDEKKYTGVWVGNDKITAIGIAVKQWVTMHGFAFNVNTDLSHFDWIIPCGINDKGVTSVEKIQGHKADFDGIRDMTANIFCDMFGMDQVRISKEEVIKLLEAKDG